MKLFEKPLVCLSLTPDDSGLLEYAAELTARFGWREVSFLHVTEPHKDSSLDQDGLRERMRELAAPVFTDITRTFHVDTGSRLDGIVETVVAHELDLIVMGHRKERSGRRSLAQRTVLMAPASVWMVPEGSPIGINKILVPTDFSDHSAEALKVAVDVARAAGLKQVEALHVYFDTSTLRSDEHQDHVRGEEEAHFKRFLGSVDTAGVQVAPVFHESIRPSNAILRVAGENRSDLLIMNTRGRNRASYVLLGSTTAETLIGTQVPILVIKRHGAKMSLLDALRDPDFLDRKAPKTN